jgi:hypothetical protein
MRNEGLNTPRSYDYKSASPRERPKLWELTFDRCQAEGCSIIGDPEYVIGELKVQQTLLRDHHGVLPLRQHAPPAGRQEPHALRQRSPAARQRRPMKLTSIRTTLIETLKTIEAAR